MNVSTYCPKCGAELYELPDNVDTTIGAHCTSCGTSSEFGDLRISFRDFAPKPDEVRVTLPREAAEFFISEASGAAAIGQQLITEQLTEVLEVLARKFEPPTSTVSCPNCGATVKPSEPGHRNGCILGAVLTVIENRGELDLDFYGHNLATLDIDEIWSILGPLIDSIEHELRLRQ